MSPLPEYRPAKTSLGPLETEILEIIWDLGKVTVKEVHEKILSDPDRELAYASVTTILQRLTKKGWLKCSKEKRSFSWEALVSKEEAKAIMAYEQLQNFLHVGNPDVIASFADSLDVASVKQLEAIAKRLEEVRKKKEQ